MADQQELLDNFVAISGVEDTAAALGFLEATNWILEDAVNLFFSTQGDAPHPQPQGREDSDEAMARRLQAESHAADEVRAPLPSKVDRLYEEDETAIAALRARALRQVQHQQQVPVDAFRDFRAEGEGAASGSLNSRISDLFKPPADLVYRGDFEQAREEARDAGKWMLVNLQSTSEFDSHRLNRDTWSHEALKEMVKGMFVFFQAYNSTDMGDKVSNYYKIYSYPTTMVVDPLTGAKLLERHGFIDPEKLIEDLVPYMDHGPKDPGAGFLAQSSLKRKFAAPSAATQPAAMADANEDPELAAAIAASLSEVNGHAGAQHSTGYDGMDDDDMDEEAIMAEIDAAQAAQAAQAAEQEAARRAAAAAPPKKTAEEVQQEAAARLAAEPADSDPAACRVAIRLPEGQRQQRRFLKTDTVQALIDWCLSLSTEAAGGRKFSLVPAMPGATPLPDAEQSLQAAGVANSMLVMKLEDA